MDVSPFVNVSFTSVVTGAECRRYRFKLLDNYRHRDFDTRVGTASSAARGFA